MKLRPGQNVFERFANVVSVTGAIRTVAQVGENIKYICVGKATNFNDGRMYKISIFDPHDLHTKGKFK